MSQASISRIEHSEKLGRSLTPITANRRYRASDTGSAAIRTTEFDLCLARGMALAGRFPENGSRASATANGSTSTAGAYVAIKDAE